MKIFLSALALSCFVSLSDAQANSQRYHGKFDEPTVTSDLCAAVFGVRDYVASHYFVGPSGLTSVLHFRNSAGAGFFEGVSLVGNYGGMGDIRAEKDLIRSGIYYHVISEGLVDAHVLVVKLTVEAKDKKDGNRLCITEAEFSVFN